MIIVLYDTLLSRNRFYPFSLVRPLALLQAGTCTIQQRWQQLTSIEVAYLTEDVLQFDQIPAADKYLCIDATVVPCKEILNQVLELADNSILQTDDGIIAFVTTNRPVFNQFPLWPAHSFQFNNATILKHVFQLVLLNGSFIKSGAESFKQKNEELNARGEANTFIGDNIMIAGGVRFNAVCINSTEGPVIIDEGVYIMEGVTIRGPVYIGKNTVIKMGARIYGGTSIFEKCTAGGEIKNSIISSYSNKAHDGYLGDSYIGSWCNLGAATSTSNVKNSGGCVNIYDHSIHGFINAGPKAGLFMGDYSRSAVNTRFNTGTTIGVCCSIHDHHPPPAFVQSFTYGLHELYEIEKAIKHVKQWMKFKQMELSNNDENVLRSVYQLNAPIFDA